MKYSIQGIVADLKTAREKKGLTQRALSAKIGIPQSHLSKIEHGMIDLQASSLIEIARALDLELVLVSRNHLSAVEAIQRLPQGSKSIPAYRLTDEEKDDTQY